MMRAPVTPTDYQPTPLGVLLRDARGEHSREWVSARADVPAETIKKWESGYTTNPPLSGVARVALVLAIPADLVLAAARGETTTRRERGVRPVDAELVRDVRALQRAADDLARRLEEDGNESR
jgi:hypothetical protein